MSKKELWYNFKCNVIGLVGGDFILFKWNGKYEESFFPVLRDAGDWIFEVNNDHT